MLTLHFRFHALLNLRVQTRSRWFARAIRNVFGQYLVADNPSGPPWDIQVDILPGKPDLDGCEVLDGRYYVRPEFVYFANRYKIAKWTVEIAGLENAETRVRIWGNAFSAYVFPYETLMDVIRIKLMLKGYVPLHALAVEKAGRSHLLVGRSGIGKTILARKLSTRGFSVVSDDTVFVNLRREVAGFLQPVGLRFTYDVEKVLGYVLRPGERWRVLAHRLIRMATFGWISLFLKADPVRLFGRPASAPVPARTVVVALQGPGPKEFAPLGLDAATDSALLGGRFEMEETLKLMHACNYVSPGNPLDKALENQRDILRGAFQGAALFSARMPEVFDEATANRIEEAFSAP
jgi:hypothetical protein